VTKVDRQIVNSPQAIARLPVYTADNQSIPLGQVAKIELADGQTMIARENSRRRITVRCDIVGRDQAVSSRGSKGLRGRSWRPACRRDTA